MSDWRIRDQYAWEPKQITIAQRLLDDAKRRVPVATGSLRASIIKRNTVIVSPATYARMIEFKDGGKE